MDAARVAVSDRMLRHGVEPVEPGFLGAVEPGFLDTVTEDNTLDRAAARKD
jgi:hypothetical protein